MLGLGYIDWQVPTLPGGASQKYVYFAQYETRIPIGKYKWPTTHRYLSLPTSQGWLCCSSKTRAAG